MWQFLFWYDDIEKEEEEKEEKKEKKFLMKCQTFVTSLWFPVISGGGSRIFSATNIYVDIDVDVDIDHHVIADFKVIVVIDVDADDEIWSICHQCVTRIAFQREFGHYLMSTRIRVRGGLVLHRLYSWPVALQS